MIFRCDLESDLDVTLVDLGNDLELGCDLELPPSQSSPLHVTLNLFKSVDALYIISRPFSLYEFLLLNICNTPRLLNAVRLDCYMRIGTQEHIPRGP